MEKANITHVLSAVDQEIDKNLISKYKHLHINVDDVDYEDILQYFASSNAFIKEGLDSGGGVLVHW